jgi:formamidopyrimidine-DNA glycosylase
MPELPEVESYRVGAEAALGRLIASVRADDGWYLKGATTADALGALLPGRRFVAARRRGKLMLLDLDGRAGPDGGAVLGLRFGMSGRLLVDGRAGVGRLLYTSPDAGRRFERFAVVFADGGDMAVVDPRRLGGVEIDPDEQRLGPDALGIGVADLRRALAGSEAPLKARLLDQSRIAGIGNLLADEILWRAGLDPTRPAGGLPPSAIRRLHANLTSGLAELIDRGGSHTGDLMPHRRPGGVCPRDGAALVRATVGGRTTWWCPRHQR